eukprot:gene26022-34623_t
MIHYDLVPNGGSKIVTADNLNDYLQARLSWIFSYAVYRISVSRTGRKTPL